MPDFPFDLSQLDLGSVMDMAKKLKDKMAELETELRRIEVETSVGAGMLTVRANGAGELTAVSLSAEAVELKDPKLLASLVLSGVNSALAQARERAEELKRRASLNAVIPGFMP